jgi:hypothetical protein
MHFRYRDPRGKIVPLSDVAALLEAIREGDVQSDTELAVGEEKTFSRAGVVVAYQQAAVAIRRAGGTTGPRKTLPLPGKQAVRIAAVAAAVLVAVALMGMRIRSIGREHARQYAVVAPTGPTPATQEEIGKFSTEFGDSAAVFQHRLEGWVERQNFSSYFKGGSLKAPAQLRGVRGATAKYNSQIDSLVSRGSGLAAVLKQRADSAESASSSMDGLLASVEDALVDWQHELAAYADLERSAAATLDSLAGFVLGRQQSFAVREGKPVFLSRADAARYRELAGALELIAKREKSWADALLERRPEWMTGIAEPDRPRFGRNVLSGLASSSP